MTTSFTLRLGSAAGGLLVPHGACAKLASRTRKSPNNTENPSLLDAPIDLDRMTRMLSRFQDVYGCAIPVFDQPSDRALALVHHLWVKRSMEFAPLGAVAAYSDQGSPWLLAPKKDCTR